MQLWKKIRQKFRRPQPDPSAPAPLWGRLHFISLWLGGTPASGWPCSHRSAATGRCPRCEASFCPQCGRVDHVLVYPSPARSILSVVTRCPRDGALLRRAVAPDPYVEHLRELEQTPFDARALDAQSELGDAVNWSPEAVRIARRCLALGLTVHANPIVTFGILGAALRELNEADGEHYLMQCALHFGEKQFPPVPALRLLAEFLEAFLELGAPPQPSAAWASEEAELLLRRDALLIAMQYLRHQRHHQPQSRLAGGA